MLFLLLAEPNLDCRPKDMTCPDHGVKVYWVSFQVEEDNEIYATWKHDDHTFTTGPCHEISDEEIA